MLSKILANRLMLIGIGINRSSTYEFCMGRGLRLDDPLSPLLFLVAVEGINLMMQEAMRNGIFHGFAI
ncbi:hypothetical protein CR513_62472, partial [Mucuna pruriens]